MTNSEKLILTFIGYDDFSNPTYKTKEGTLLKDVNDNVELPYLHTVSGNDIDGKKPEWLTWDDILRYEALMCTVSEQKKEGLF